MEQDLHLVSDLALILISAGVITLIFRWLKQPLILGYIVAGFIVGPHFDLFPDVVETHVVEQWSELGIIFLLFALGLEFSFKKLISVGSSALITAGTNFLGMFFIGLGIGKAMDWSTMECIFLGGMLSMSSTTIIIKAFDDLDVKRQKFTGIVFGTLVVEDLIAILLMVLLSTAAVSQQFAGEEMLMSLLKLAFFIILWFVAGIYMVPTFLKWSHKRLNDETLLILSIGLCFGMVVLATYVGFSSALGAFLMGSIFAETLQGERIEKALKGIKDLFGAIFFVSVGMMVDPAVLVEYWKPILILTLVVIVGKSLFSIAGVLISGNPLKIAVRSGLSLAQIGEFAFIIAALGRSLGVMRGFIYPVIVSVSVITTFTTPYLIRISGPVSIWISKKLPESWARKLDEYTSAPQVKSHPSDWKKLLTSYFMRLVVYSVLLLAILLGSTNLLAPFMNEQFSHMNTAAIKWICVVITLLVMTPFLFGLGIYHGGKGGLLEKMWQDNKSTHGPLIAMILLRGFMAVAFIAAVFFRYFAFSYWVLIAIFFGLVIFYFLSRRNIHYFEKMEQRFYANLNQKEEYEKQQAPMRTSISSQMSGMDLVVENVVVSPTSSYIGHKLQTIPFRREFGINILKIIRGHKIINLPKNDDRVYPYDTLVIVGTGEQVTKFMALMEADSAHTPESASDKIAVQSFVIKKNSHLLGKSLAESNVRQVGCMVLGIERGAESFMNPSAQFTFELGDVVWIVGEASAVAQVMG